ncbi:MAG: hypothetical protein ACE37D_11580 [Pseudomonadales bacterium]
MKREQDRVFDSQHKSIQSILKSLEKDLEQESKEYKNLNEVLINYFIHDLNYSDTKKATSTASSFIKNYEDTLKKVQSIEKRESKLFSTTSNVALLTIIGAAISASAAPFAVVPAATIAAITAFLGYIFKLKLDSAAKDEVKDLIKNINKIGMGALGEEGLPDKASGTPKSDAAS